MLINPSQHPTTQSWLSMIVSCIVLYYYAFSINYVFSQGEVTCISLHSIFIPGCLVYLLVSKGLQVSHINNSSPVGGVRGQLVWIR